MAVSIVIPVYNLEKYLRKCLDSVTAQGSCVEEIILVNDGSTDGSLDICKEYAQKDARIRIIDKANEGVAAAVIDGVNAATCEYVGFVDGDDYIEPNMFEELFSSALQNDADVVVCTYDSENEDGNRFWRRDFGVEGDGVFVKHDGKFDISILPTFGNGKYISASRWNKIFKRELFVSNSAFQKTGIRVGEDLALCIPIVMSANVLAYVDKCLYHYVQRGGSAVHVVSERDVLDWEKSIAILRAAAADYGYDTSKLDESAALLLLQNCLHRAKSYCKSHRQKKRAYRTIGENATARELLRSVKICGSAKTKLLFKLLKLRLYGLLSIVY